MSKRSMQRRRDRVRDMVAKGTYRNRDILVAGYRDIGWFNQVDPGLRVALEAFGLDLAAQVHNRLGGEAIDVKFDWTKRRARSKGGTYRGAWRSRLNTVELPAGPGINLAMRDRRGIWKEYSHIAPWAEIGDLTFDPDDWYGPLRCLLLHECTHALLMPRLTNHGHGVEFCDLLAELRAWQGLVDPTRPSWVELTPREKQVVCQWRRVPADPMRALRDATNWRKEMRRAQQQARRRRKRELQEQAE